MDIARFTSLRVELEQGAGLEAVLEREGLTQLQWLAHERRFLRALVDSVRSGDGSLAVRYAAAFGPQAAEAPRSGVEPHAAASALREAPAAASPPPAPAMPAYPAPAYPAPAPAAPAHSVPAYPEPLHAQLAPPASALDETSFVAAIPVADALPFRADAEAAPPPSVSAEFLAEARDLVGETAEVSVLTAADLAEALPFGRTPARGVAADGPRAAPAAAAIDATGYVPYVKAGPTLGFRAVADRRPPPPAAAALAAEARDLAGETAEVAVLTAADLAAALPFGRSGVPNEERAPAAGGELTLEQYASLRCELEWQRRPRRELLASYGVETEDALSKLNHRWAARFRDDPATYGLFRAAYDRYSAWVGAQKGG